MNIWVEDLNIGPNEPLARHTLESQTIAETYDVYCLNG